MEDLRKILEISESLNFSDLSEQIRFIQSRSNIEDVDVLLPLVGEFSSGKTTLLNSLTDSKVMETATKPTTATIYRLHFGSNTCCASYINTNGDSVEIEDLSQLKNELLHDSRVVDLFDTSDKIDKHIILIDTPGISSPDVSHKETLVNFLPQADAILAVVDINQQITKSLVDFIEMTKITQKSIFLVITKIDTKSPADIELVKQSISKNCQIPADAIACVSSDKGDLKEFYSLIDKVKAKKQEIVSKSNQSKLEDIKKQMIDRIDFLIKSSESDKSLEQALEDTQSSLKDLEYEIRNTLKSAESLIARTKEDIVDEFEMNISSRLDAIAVSKSPNYNQEVRMSINGVSSLLLDKFKNIVLNDFLDTVKRNKKLVSALDLDILRNIDFNDLDIGEMDFNIDLNSAGHEYDKLIASGIKYVAIGAAIGAAVVATAGVAASGAAASGAAASGAAASGAAASGATVIAADVAGDVVGGVIAGKMVEKSMTQVGKQVANEATKKGVKKEIIKYRLKKELVNREGDIKEGINDFYKKGIIENCVGLISEKLFGQGKPQRRKLISNYILNNLNPQFKERMDMVERNSVALVSGIINESSKDVLDSQYKELEQLRNDFKSSTEEFKTRVNQLRDFKTQLL